MQTVKRLAKYLENLTSFEAFPKTWKRSNFHKTQKNLMDEKKMAPKILLRCEAYLLPSIQYNHPVFYFLLLVGLLLLVKMKWETRKTFLSMVWVKSLSNRENNSSPVIRQNGRISKQMFHENKARQTNFPKNEHFLPPPPLPSSHSPDTRTHVCVSGGKK